MVSPASVHVFEITHDHAVVRTPRVARAAERAVAVGVGGLAGAGDELLAGLGVPIDRPARMRRVGGGVERGGFQAFELELLHGAAPGGGGCAWVRPQSSRGPEMRRW